MKIGDLIAFKFNTFDHRHDKEVFVGLVTENLPSGGIMIRWLDNNEDQFISNGNISRNEWEAINESG